MNQIDTTTDTAVGIERGDTANEGARVRREEFIQRLAYQVTQPLQQVGSLLILFVFEPHKLTFSRCGSKDQCQFREPVGHSSYNPYQLWSRATASTFVRSPCYHRSSTSATISTSSPSPIWWPLCSCATSPVDCCDRKEG
jgi:hypothetical protein